LKLINLEIDLAQFESMPRVAKEIITSKAICDRLGLDKSQMVFVSRVVADGQDSLCFRSLEIPMDLNFRVHIKRSSVVEGSIAFEELNDLFNSLAPSYLGFCDHIQVPDHEKELQEIITKQNFALNTVFYNGIYYHISDKYKKYMFKINDGKLEVIKREVPF